MIKVLVIDNSNYVTGAARSIARFAAALSSEYEFHWAVTDKISDENLGELYGNSKSYRFNFVEVSKRPGRLIRYFPRLIANAVRLNRIIKEQGISILHVNDLYNMTGAVVGVMNRNVKVVYHVRLLRNSYIGPLYGMFLNVIDRTANAIVCCSRAVSKDVGERKVPATVIYDSEDPGSDAVAQHVLNDEVKTIAYVGNIIPGKGHDLALQTLVRLREKGLNVKLRFIGKVDDSEISRGFKVRLDDMVSSAGLTEAVEFAGFRRDVASEMQRADLVLNLSESESFSMVCIEALKAGVPLVVSDCGGPGEIIEHMRSGWLVANRDVDGAVEAIMNLSNSLAQREKFRDAGKVRVREKFNVGENAKLLSNVYRAVMK